MVLLRTLKFFKFGAFGEDKSLKTIYAEDGCKAYFCLTNLPETVKVGPLPTTTVGKISVWDLRDLKRAVIPEGAERVGSYWFWGSDVEEVIIPSSAREIGAGAFGNCKKLAKVEFAGVKAASTIAKEN